MQPAVDAFAKSVQLPNANAACPFLDTRTSNLTARPSFVVSL